MKRAAIAATAAVMVALLAGCSAPGEEAAVPAPAESTTSTAPLTAQEPATQTAADGDAAYLAAVREALSSDTVIPNATDEQLLAAGQRACDEIAAGTDVRTLSLIDGEQPNGLGTYNDSAVIIGSARASLCD